MSAGSGDGATCGVPRRVALATLGCKVNAYDSAAIADRLRARGCQIVPAEAVADVVIVNSCTITDTADAETRQLVRRVRRANPAARVILTGCFARTQPAVAAGLSAVDFVVSLDRLDALVEAAIAARPAIPRVEVGRLRREPVLRAGGARTFTGRTRAFLKVQDGCDLFCTFCIVPLARGRSRSLAPRAVLDEMAALGRAGFEEVVLTGVHLGGWGQDLRPARDLGWLLDRLAEQAAVSRIRLSSIDPHEVTEALVRRLAASPIFCPHLHVPLQAADDTVLSRMRRRYDVALARDRLAMIRELLPDAAIGTDLIAGFPGEDDAAFARTLAFVEESPLSYLHVFPYSVRRGTTAAKLDGHQRPAVIAGRARALREADARKRRAFARRFAGREGEVLVEHRRDRRTGTLVGYTRNYLRTRLAGPDAWMGRRITVRLRVHENGEVRGEPPG